MKTILLLTLAFGMVTLHACADPKITHIEVKKNGNVKMIVTSDVPFEILATRDFKSWTRVDASKEKRHEVTIDKKDARANDYRFYVARTSRQ